MFSRFYMTFYSFAANFIKLGFNCAEHIKLCYKPALNKSAGLLLKRASKLYNEHTHTNGLTESYKYV